MSLASLPPLLGLHHVTAITGDASANLAFYRGLLGLRLVKRTVNQDDVSAYHLFYGDALGHPGTEVTFFHWPNADANKPGHGTIERIWLGVRNEPALAYWRERLAAPSRALAGKDPLGRPALCFDDPEGQRLALVAVGADSFPASEPWQESDVPSDHAIHGMAAMGLDSLRPDATSAFFRDVLGFRHVEPRMSDAQGTTLECGPGGAGAQVFLRVADGAGAANGASDGSAHVALTRGWPGIGGVHHVAFRVPDDDAHRAWHEHLQTSGVHCTPIIDRYYFRSIYFREPGGILCEIATDGPGFATDEPRDTLGERLALPPFLEPRRATIEAGLPPLDG